MDDIKHYMRNNLTDFFRAGGGKNEGVLGQDLNYIRHTMDDHECLDLVERILAEVR